MAKEDEYFISKADPYLNKPPKPKTESEIQTEKETQARYERSLPYFNLYKKAKSEYEVHLQEDNQKRGFIKNSIDEFRLMILRASQSLDSGNLEEAQSLWHRTETTFEEEIPKIKKAIEELWNKTEKAKAEETHNWNQYMTIRDGNTYTPSSEGITKLKERNSKTKEQFREEIRRAEKLYLHYRDEQQIKARLQR
ncbi:hypothetical protein OAF63_03550 [Saprospiraceae bacterium]|jgi:hypothetical protein|nr:hypothetical protein [Saprospiraceae bacterium]